MILGSLQTGLLQPNGLFGMQGSHSSRWHAFASANCAGDRESVVQQRDSRGFPQIQTVFAVRHAKQ